jgi:hypothetical protein
MNDEQQAQRLARWLDAGGQTPPPEGVDPDVIEAVYAMRPELAPAPRVSIDDILGGVTSGPFADDLTEEDTGAEVVPFPVPVSMPAEIDEVPEPANDPVLDDEVARPWWRGRWTGGVAGVLAAAAAVLLVVDADLSAPESAAPTQVATAEAPRKTADGRGVDRRPEPEPRQPEALQQRSGIEDMQRTLVKKGEVDKSAPAAPARKPIGTRGVASSSSGGELAEYKAKDALIGSVGTENTAVWSARDADQLAAAKEDAVADLGDDLDADDDAEDDGIPELQQTAEQFDPEELQLDVPSTTAELVPAGASGFVGGSVANTGAALGEDAVVFADEPPAEEVEEADLLDAEEEEGVALETLSYDRSSAAYGARETRRDQRRKRLSKGEEAPAPAADEAEPPPRPPAAAPASYRWQNEVAPSRASEVETALARAGSIAASDPRRAAESLQTYITSPAPSGIAAATAAIRYALAADDPDWAVRIAERGLALSATDPGRGTLLQLLAQARARSEAQ